MRGRDQDEEMGLAMDEVSHGVRETKLICNMKSHSCSVQTAHILKLKYFLSTLGNMVKG